MSAHKRALITPDSAALQRLEDLSAQLRATSRPDPVLLTAARKETQVELKRVAAHSQRRQEIVASRLDEQLVGLDARLVNLARATEVAISSQSQQLNAIAQSRASQADFASEVQTLLDQQSAYFQDLLNHNQSLHDEALADFANQLQHLQRRSHKADHIAVQSLKHSQALLEGMQQAYPGNPSYTGIQNILEQAQQNLLQGFAEAALSATQQASWQIQVLRVQIEQDLTERGLLRAAALEKLAIIRASVAANEDVSAVDLEGRTLDYPLNIDFWTEGGWTRLNQALESTQEYLSHPVESLGKTDLSDLLTQSLPSIEQAIPGLVSQARRAVLASQLRFHMAEAVVNALGEQGFIPEQASYIGGDMRQSYQLALHNLEGSQLVVTLQPKPEGMQNQIDIQSQDFTRRTPHELRQRARELARSLRRYGLQVLKPAQPALREARADYAAAPYPGSSLINPAPTRQYLPRHRTR